MAERQISEAVLAGSGHRRWWLPAWLLLGLSRLAVLLLPFRRVAAVLGGRSEAAVWVPLLDRDQEATALRIGRAIRSASRFTPWSSNCFAQALSARILLAMHRVPCMLFFGVSRDGGSARMVAHAWVAAGRIRVTGGDGFAQYVVVGSFAGGVSAAAIARPLPAPRASTDEPD